MLNSKRLAGEEKKGEGALKVFAIVIKRMAFRVTNPEETSHSRWGKRKSTEPCRPPAKKANLFSIKKKRKGVKAPNRPRDRGFRAKGGSLEGRASFIRAARKTPRFLFLKERAPYRASH